MRRRVSPVKPPRCTTKEEALKVSEKLKTVGAAERKAQYLAKELVWKYCLAHCRLSAE